MVSNSLPDGKEPAAMPLCRPRDRPVAALSNCR